MQKVSKLREQNKIHTTEVFFKTEGFIDDILNNIEEDYYVLTITHGLATEVNEKYRNMDISRFKNVKRVDVYGKHGYTTKRPQILLNDRPNGDFKTSVFLGNVVSHMSTFYPDKKGNITLPTTILTITEEDLKSEFYSSAMGIYLFDSRTKNYEKILTIEEYYEFIKPKTVLTYTDVIGLIMKLLKQKMGDNIKTKTIAVGFFSCRNVPEKYIEEYIQEHAEELNQNKVPFVVTQKTENYMYPSLKNTKILKNANGYLFKPLYIKTKYEFVKMNWSGALAQIRHKGCGLNVLAFYMFMVQYLARTKTVCLNDDGTSIFRIIEYLDFYLMHRNVDKIKTEDNKFTQIIRSLTPIKTSPLLGKRKRTSKNMPNNRKKSYTKKKSNSSPKTMADFNSILIKWMRLANPQNNNNYPDNTKYMVSRHSINDLVKVFETLFLYENINGCTVIIKMYESFKHKDKVNQRGHTVSFLFLKNNVHLIDPQNQNATEMEKYIYTKGENKPINLGAYKNFHYFDMIWFSTQEFTDNDILYQFKKLKQTNDFDTAIERYVPGIIDNLTYNFGKLNLDTNNAECKIIQYTDDINYGGENYKKISQKIN